MKNLVGCLLTTLLVQPCWAGDALFNGSKVSNKQDSAAYTAMTASKRINGEWRQKAFVFNYEQLAVNYGENVDFQLRKEQIILCPQTVDFLYSQTMLPVLRYKKGTRPALEKVVEKITANCRNEQEKALQIMRFCRDLKFKAQYPNSDPRFQFGGTEEELIAKGEDLCETLGRLFVALCEIADMPARIIMHNIGGHITAEVYADGKWGYIDPRFGVYFLNKSGKLASLHELMQDYSLLDQAISVRRETAGQFSWEQRVASCRNKYFTRQEVNGFQYYSLADSGKYRYAKISRADAVKNGLFRVNKVYAALINAVFTPDEKTIYNYFSQPLSRSLGASNVPVRKNQAAVWLIAPEKSSCKSFYTASYTILERINCNPNMKGLQVKVAVGFPGRLLTPSEKIEVYINGSGPLKISGQTVADRNGENKVYTLNAEAQWLYNGENIIRMVYYANDFCKLTPLKINTPVIQIVPGEAVRSIR